MPPGASPRWLLAAPHRLCFFAALLVLAAATAGSAAAWHFWAAQGAAGAVVAPSLAHALVMVFGFMPMFITGFFFTAGPRWLRRPPVPANRLLLPVALHLAGWGVFSLCIAVHRDGAAAGLGLATAGLALCTWRFGDLLKAAAAAGDGAADAPARITPEALLIGAAGAVLASLLALAAIGVAFNDRGLADGAVRSALWSGLCLAFVAAMHRIVPFFDAGAWPALDARWPHALLWAMCATACMQGALTMAQALWALPSALQTAAATWEAAAAIGVFALALRWSRVQSLRPRLVRMLHLGLLWLGTALALSAVARIGGAVDARWEMAGLHALAIGYFGTLMLAMVTRVSCAQSGRAVVADAFLWRAFWLLQAACVARVGAALWPVAAPVLLRVALVAWAASVLPWALRSACWYLSPDEAPRTAKGGKARVIAIRPQ